jgi:hypothetical protein
MNPDTSTGYEFTFKGKTYRDDDTAPEADKRVDVYDPSHPPDTFHYSANISSKEPQELPPIEQMRADYPQLADYSDDQILSELKPKVAPNMSDDDFKKAAYDPNGADTFKKQADQMSLMQKARLDFPQYAQLNDDDFTKRVYGLLSKSGQIDPKVTSLDTFKNQLTPPNPVITWLQNTFKQVSDFVTTPGAADDPWTGVAKDYGKMFERAQGTLHESAAGLYGAPQGLANLGQSPLGILDAVAKQAGIDSQVQKGYDQFTQKYLQTPFDDFFRKSLHMLNVASNAQRLAAQAHMEKAKDLNPVLAVTADIAGSLPEMAATFGVGAAAKGATKAELVGRALWATMYQASAANGKATDATAKQHFLSQYRSGATAALQQLLFSSPYGRLTTGLMNSILGANTQDIQNWIDGKPSEIGETGIATAVNFILGYGWGNDRVSDAPHADLDEARKAWEAQDIKKAQDLADRAFVLMPEDEAMIHATNLLTLTDILSATDRNGEKFFNRAMDVSGEKPYSGNIILVQQRVPLTPERLKEQMAMIDAGTPDQLKMAVSGVLPTEPGVSVHIPGIAEQPMPKPHPWIPDAFSQFVSGGEEEPVVPRETKATPETPARQTKPPGPLKQPDVDRFVDTFYYGGREAIKRRQRQSGAAYIPVDEMIAAAKKVGEIGHNIIKNIHDSPLGELVRMVPQALNIEHGGTEKTSQAVDDLVGANARISQFRRTYVNAMVSRINDDVLGQDYNLSKTRSDYIKKYNPSEQLQLLFDYENHRPTGDPVLDAMRKVDDQIYADLAERENAVGLLFDPRDNYIWHSFKDKDKADQFLQSYFQRYGDPGFMNPRQFEDYETAYYSGLNRDAQGKLTGGSKWEPASTDPEEIRQGRIFEHARQMERVTMLDKWHDEGDAYETTQPDIPDESKAWPKIRSPKRKEAGGVGTTYFVHPEKAKVIQRAWDPQFNNPLAKATLGNVITMLKAIKGATVPFRLWGMAHLMHIPQIRLGLRQAWILRDRMLPEGNFEADWFGDKVSLPRSSSGDLAKAFGDEFTWGIQQMMTDTSKYSDLLDVMQNTGQIEKLSPADQWLFKQALDAGFSPGLSHERQIQIADWFSRQFPKWLKDNKLLDKFTEFGLRVWTATDFQKWAFGKVIPAVKLAVFAERVGDLYRARPELLDIKNDRARLRALRKLNQMIDVKLGEMNFDNVFAVKWIKNLGIGTFLSMAWQLGLVDYATGGIKDLGDNALHADRVLKTLKEQGKGAAGRQVLTDRLLTTVNYTMAVMVTNSMMTGLNMALQPFFDPKGKRHQFEWKDMFFPWVGNNPDGTDRRWRGMAFPGELMTIWHHLNSPEGSVKGTEDLIGNKMNSFLAAGYQAAQNTNYIGQKISDSDLFTLHGAYDRAAYMISQTLLPIGEPQYGAPFQSALSGEPLPKTTEKGKDAIAAFFGFNQAPLWTGRTDLANQILQARQQERGRTEGASVDQQKQWDARDNLRTAFQQGDQKSIEAGIKAALQAGLTKKQIELTYKNRKVSTDKLAFKAMPSKDQFTWMRRMSREDLKEYWPFAHHDARRLFNERRTQPANP